MGTITKMVGDMQTRRVAYQAQKTREEMQRIAGLLSNEERKVFFAGGFVRVPEEERLRQRIDAYPYLIK